MKKVVLAMDSFKGCLSSAEVEQAAEEGIKEVCPDCEVIRFPIADGGEGILEILVEATHGTYHEVLANDPHASDENLLWNFGRWRNCFD